MKIKRGKLLASAFGGLLLAVGALAPAYAAAVPSDFNLQVTPSPLVTTVKPGVKTQIELKVRNGGSGTENLKIEPRSFNFKSSTGQISLDDTAPPGVAPWVSFSAPKFTVQPGQWFSQQIIFNVPKDAGFSYSFALVISRQSDPKPTNGGRLIKGSLAVFTLVNVDRPGAKSSLEVKDFTISKHLYEYLPATLSIHFKNNGNTIAQPYGNIFVQRTANSKKPLAVLPVNGSKSYILPGTERVITASWNDGFATYEAAPQPDGTSKNHLVLNWSKFSHFRIGRYTAHLVAVYNDGQHDVPIEGTVSFWVIPWRAILLTLFSIVAVWLLSLWLFVKLLRRHDRKRARREQQEQKKEAEK